MAGAAFQLFPPPPRASRQTSSVAKPHHSSKSSIPEPVVERKDSAGPLDEQADFHEPLVEDNSASGPPSVMAATPFIMCPQQAHVSSPSSLRTPPSAFNQAFASEPERAGSPAFSSCPTLVRGNSTATRIRSGSPQQENIPMRSMFPVYDPTLPLSEQSYKPVQASPTQLPRGQISRSPYFHGAYIPHSNITTSRASSLPMPKTFFTPSHLLDNLWVATNGQEDPAVQLFTLKMHRATEANPTITFGPTPSLPFYSLAQSNFSSGRSIHTHGSVNELLVQRHHPTQPRVLPIAQLDLVTAPSLDSATFNPHQQESATHLTSIYPKLAALQALDTAANSPAASHIAVSDPTAQSPAARRLAEDVLAGSAERECCMLTWTREDPKQQSNPWSQHIPMDGSYQLCHPTLGTFPIRIEGDCSGINKPSIRPVTAVYTHNVPSALQQTGFKPASISLLNPFILSPAHQGGSYSPLLTASQPGTPRRVSTTPSEMSLGQIPGTIDATADDTTLVKLDFTNDALTLNLGALVRFGNPFLPDVTASALLAVAVAEATRGRPSKKLSVENFTPPPPSTSLADDPDNVSICFKDAFLNGFGRTGGKTNTQTSDSKLMRFSSFKRTAMNSHSSKLDRDIELGEWYGKTKTKRTKTNETKVEKQARKKAEDRQKLPLLARAIIAAVKLVFKTVVFFLHLIFKIISGLVVMLTRNSEKL